ncbi:hypothetical protein OSB04_025409 [Centaurea solstitialis]|uniref:Uncharacterized protein n=1 Tax=Centaurea solstitialis TaxID=347529 RepID=A0AA38W3Z6_9ASTR|nr:hypothetical protein OSB04_025409 [Centaurea solstitialis]
MPIILDLVESGSLKAMNLALLSKCWWRFKSENVSLWKKVIQYLHRDSGGFNKAKPSRRFPSIWNNILQITKDFDKVNIPLAYWFQEHRYQHNSNVVIKWAVKKYGSFTVSSVRKAFDDFYLN